MLFLATTAVIVRTPTLNLYAVYPFSILVTFGKLQGDLLKRKFAFIWLRELSTRFDGI